MKIKQLHFLSGIIISLFVGIHLFNHVYSLFGIEQHIQMMDTLRLVYRNVMVESILMLAVLVQIISGLNLFFKKRKEVSTFFEKLQIYSGLYLAFFLVIHVGAVMGGRLVLDLDTNYYFGAAGLVTFPFNLFFVPYYSMSILSFFAHLAAVHSQKMKKTLLGLTPHRQSNLILIIGFCALFLIMYGLTNHFNGVEIPVDYNVLIGK